jgi:hypothetical protein
MVEPRERDRCRVSSNLVLDFPERRAYVVSQFGELKDEAFPSFSSEGVFILADFPGIRSVLRVTCGTCVHMYRTRDREAPLYAWHRCGLSASS